MARRPPSKVNWAVAACFFQLFSVVFADDALGDDIPRLVLISGGQNGPQAVDVGPLVVAQLSPVELAVDVPQRAFPADDMEWRQAAREEAGVTPGLLALIGWWCEAAGKCELTIVETQDMGIIHIQTVLGTAESVEGESGDVDPSQGEGKSTVGEADLDVAMAGMIRETLLGGVLAEMSRIRWEGPRPSVMPSSSIPVPNALEGPAETDAVVLATRPVFWLELGYTGEFSHPSRAPINGASLTAAFSPVKLFVPAVSVGWLGVRKEESAVGDVTTHRLPVSLQLRLTLPVGTAWFSVAPVGRLDVVFYEVDPSTGAAESGVDLEVHVGGVVFWHFPMPRGVVELVVGTGVLATVYAEDYRIAGETILPQSSVRVLWLAAVAFSAMMD